MATAIYLAHLNPLTNAHADIIKELEKKDEVVVMPVRFLVHPLPPVRAYAINFPPPPPVQHNFSFPY